MKVKLRNKDKEISKEHYELIKEFICFLQNEFPLIEDIVIYFLPKRIGQMSTGSSVSEERIIKVLTKNRLNRDILRTIAHEWVHQHQSNVLGRQKGPDIGGKNEDEANAFAGRLVKMFEKEYPSIEKKMYEHYIRTF